MWGRGRVGGFCFALATGSAAYDGSPSTPLNLGDTQGGRAVNLAAKAIEEEIKNTPSAQLDHTDKNHLFHLKLRYEAIIKTTLDGFMVPE